MYRGLKYSVRLCTVNKRHTSVVDSAHIAVFIAIGVGAIILMILLIVGLLLRKRLVVYVLCCVLFV